MFILGLIVGIVITIAAMFFIAYVMNRRDEKKRKFRRRGLFTGTFTTDYEGKKDTYDVSVEVGEVERTKTKSKIVIIGKIQSSRSLSHSITLNLPKIIEGWRETDSSRIEWFEEHPEDVRNEKIDNLLE